MTKRKVIVELRYAKRRARAVAEMADEVEMALDTKLVPSMTGITYDESFAPVELPGLVAVEGGQEPVEGFARMEIDARPAAATYFVRGEIDEAAEAGAAAGAQAGDDVVGVYADVAIQSTITCIGSPAVGTHLDVENLLGVPHLRQRGMTGKDVAVAIVDTGVNVQYLNAHGKNPAFDKARSWSPRPGDVPGSLPVDHGTMCAFDVCIAAPACTLLDVAVLRSQQPGGTVMEGLLSDAVRGYSRLLRVAQLDVGKGKRYRALVLNNSWGMFHPSWDYPVGHPGNYSHNPNHPFNRMVGTLERAGGDIFFAAGNCGRECPDGRCQGLTTGGVYGANSHAQVTCVAGVDTRRNRVGYSTIGPGRLERLKPDVAGYTHFAGSGVYAVDGGTSAATPVVTGLVAAVRTRCPLDLANARTLPATVRRLLRRTAIDRGAVGYDFEYGYGIVDGKPFADVLTSGTGATSEEGEAGAEGEQTVHLPVGAAAAAGLQTAFLRIAPDASPGMNTLTINGLPRGTRTVSAWMTEWALPNNPHAGGARFDTISVQLYNDGTQCRVVYRLNWNNHLPTAVQLIYG